MAGSRLFGAAFAFALLLVPSGAPAADDAATMDALLARFHGLVGLSARFHEEKHIALLAQPLVSDGTVHYAPPDKIARHTLTPSPASVVLDGATLRFGDGTSERAIDTGASPVVRAFVDSFRAVLAGDRAALERSFVLDFHALGGAGPKWELGLVPRDAPLARIIREIPLRRRRRGHRADAHRRGQRGRGRDDVLRRRRGPQVLGRRGRARLPRRRSLSAWVEGAGRSSPRSRSCSAGWRSTCTATSG